VFAATEHSRRLLERTRQMNEKIVASRVPVIAYVTPSGGRAASAGFFILEASDVAAMAPGTNTGASSPVALGGQMDETMRHKVENDASAWLRSTVEKRGRNADAGRDHHSTSQARSPRRKRLTSI
jgi:membrane-bound serine protease (ClpP class)